MTTTKTSRTAASSSLCERDIDAVAELLDPWITAAVTRPDHTEVPLLGTREWTEADPDVQLAAVAVFVIGCLVERDPIVIAGRLAAEVAVLRTSRMAAARQASHAISAAGEWSAVARRLIQRADDDQPRRPPR